MGAFALAVRWRTGTSSHPAVIFALFWCLIAFGAELIVSGATIYSPALAYIAAAVVAFGLPSFFMKWEPALTAARSRRSVHVSTPQAYRTGFLALPVIAVACLALNLVANGSRCWTWRATRCSSAPTISRRATWGR